MPQIFKMGEYCIYFWTNENNPLNQSTYISSKESLPKMQQRYGLSVQENYTCFL